MSWKNEAKEKNCVICGVSYFSSSGRSKYCSKCKRDAANKRHREFIKRDALINENTVCCICGGKYSERIAGKPYCRKHSFRYRKYGQFDLPEKPTSSVIEIIGNEAKITTKSGQVILIDAEDAPLAANKSWYISSNGYAASKTKGESVEYLHRLIMRSKLSEDLEVDHISGEKMDNRKTNLRVCTHKENLRNLGIHNNNTSGYPGVSLNRTGKYRVGIVVDNRNINIGYFDTFEEAVDARRKAELKYFGQYTVERKRKILEERK